MLQWHHSCAPYQNAMTSQPLGMTLALSVMGCEGIITSFGFAVEALSLQQVGRAPMTNNC